MSTPADSPPIASDAQAVIAFRGPDSAKFLQGQLSADLEKLNVGANTLAGLHNPQGRVIALLAITRSSSEEFLAVLPRELLTPVITRLNKYVLRAKVRITDASAEYPALREGGVDRDLAQVRAGVPQVYAATSEAFVAQMINLDLLGAIAFDKGCYTGQEVIARAHYRGRVKRRLQRWSNHSGTALKPGDSARGPDGRSLSVVRVAALPGNHAEQEVLAVGNFAAGTEAAEAAPVERADGVELRGPLPLPYELPP